MNILGTGLSGLVGSRVVELLSSDYVFEDLSLDTGVDITKKEVVQEHIAQTKSAWIFHFAAFTDVDGAERERAAGIHSKSWIVNVIATGYIVEACRRAGKKLLYISTDFVFDGHQFSYTEADTPRPSGWYAETKYEGEKLVGTLGARGLVVRIANPYRARFEQKQDFMHKIISGLAKGETIMAPNDQQFVPTFIDDIALALRKLVRTDASGIYHVVGSQALSPYDAALKIADAFGYASSRIRSIPFKEYFRGRAPRPFSAVLKNDKMTQLGVPMCSFDEGLIKVRTQERNMQ